MYNDDFKDFCRTAWEDEGVFFKMIDIKGTTDVKHKFKLKSCFVLCVQRAHQKQILRENYM